VIGAGRHLLEHPLDTVGLRLTAHDVTPSGLALLEYDVIGPAPVADYAGVNGLS
jgi:hypothetical protein